MTRKNPTWKDIKPILSEMTSSQLRGILQDLYQFNAENKAFFHSRFLSGQTDSDYLETYKARIRKAICPKEPWHQDVELSAGRKTISEFKKANGNIRDSLSLMLYYVKCGNDFTLEFGDIDEAFYGSMETMFGAIVKTLVKQKDEDLVAEFMPSLKIEVDRVECIGWGYSDGLTELFDDLLKAFPEKCGVAI